MSAYIYLFLLILISACQTILNKKLQLGFQQTLTQFCCYLLLNSIFASFFLSAANGFKVNFNIPTLLFSCAFAVVVSFSLTLNLLALSRVEIPVVSITGTAGNIITTLIFGVIYLNEKLTLKLLVAALLILVAVIIPYLRLYSSKGNNSILICALLFLNSGASVIVTKLFTLSKTVTDSNSFFVITNLILMVLCLLLLIFLWFNSKENREIIKRPFKKKQVFQIGVITAFSNLSSIISILAVAKMPLTVYTITFSSLSLIASTLLSKFYFKEKLQKEIIISVILAIGAITLNA